MQLQLGCVNHWVNLRFWGKVQLVSHLAAYPLQDFQWAIKLIECQLFIASERY
jgi:hypothetical protein